MPEQTGMQIYTHLEQQLSLRALKAVLVICTVKPKKLEQRWFAYHG